MSCSTGGSGGKVAEPLGGRRCARKRLARCNHLGSFCERALQQGGTLYYCDRCGESKRVLIRLLFPMQVRDVLASMPAQIHPPVQPWQLRARLQHVIRTLEG